MKKTLKNQKGFSLIELMIVVAIIGVLSAVAIPNFNRFQRKARQSEGKAMMGGMFTAEKAFRAEWETYYGDLGAIGYSVDGQLRYDGGFSAKGGDPGLVTILEAQIDEPGLMTVEALCGDASYGTQCGMSAVAPTLAGGTAPTKNGFTIRIQGEIGGASEDIWTMTHTKTVAMVQDGTAD